MEAWTTKAVATATCKPRSHRSQPPVTAAPPRAACPTPPLDEVTVPRLRSRRRCLLRVREFFSEFCANTTLHGLKYVGEPDKPYVQRVCWMLAFALSLSVCAAFIWQAKHKWDTTPVIVTFAESSYPVSKVPFPAVTICSEAKFNRDVFSFKEMLRQGNNISEEQMKNLQYAKLVCWPRPNREAETIDDRAVDFLLKAAHSVKDTLDECRWHYDWGACRRFFDVTITEEGVCYTFNRLNYDDFFTENV